MLISFVLIYSAICCLQEAQENLELLVSDLKSSIDVHHLAPLFPPNAVISFPTGPAGTRLGYALVVFQTLQDKLNVGGCLSIFVALSSHITLADDSHICVFTGS